MNSFAYLKSDPRAGRPKRPARLHWGRAAAGAMLAIAPASSYAASPSNGGTGAAAAPAHGGQSIEDFYAARAGRPLWLAPGNEQAAHDLVRMLSSAQLDGLNPRTYRTRDLQRALRSAWGGNPSNMQRAERMLSQALVDYARDLRTRTPELGVIYVDPQLRPSRPSPRRLLDSAAASPSLERFVGGMEFMHPYYGQLRQAMSQVRDERQRSLIRVNMERARLLPAATADRYVLVNSAAQRLFMIENGQPVDMMRVVVGKPAQPTPMMAALIRYTSLNPYWNVPSDLAAERVAPFVVKDGLSYLRAKGYQVLSDWSDKAKIVNPSTIDWKAVADGRTEIRLRQLPGPGNSMGAMKFMFPNAQGIYLHDTPSTELFSEASRLFSGGCVRLEAAPRLAAWLHGKPVRAKGAKPEQKLSLEQPVPVYLTYMTVVPSGSTGLAHYQDIYGTDAQRLAQLGSGRSQLAVR